MLAILRFLILVFFVPVAAIAADEDWRVAKTSGQVRYTLDRATWVDLHAGDAVPNAAWILTGPRGRAQLVRGVESIGFQPGTMASITTTSGFFSRKTQIVQQVGALDLEIEKRSQPHTTVQTPFLAALVKGTIFHVSVGKTKASVSVDRGLVQVTSFASGQRSNVGPRQSATVDRARGMTVAGQASAPSVTSVAPSVAPVPAVGAAKLSGKAAKEAKSSVSSADATSEASASNGKGKGDSRGSGNEGRSSGSGNGGGKSNSGGNGSGHGNGSGNSGHGNGHSGGSGGNSGNGNSGGQANGGKGASGNNGSGNNGHGQGGGNSGKGNNVNGNGQGKNK
ncbi:FecR domain-containing protein (plasmid) [Sinorhizobium sp. B11]